jgi:hypothetical protein
MAGIFQNGVFSCGFGFVNTGGSALQIFDTISGTFSWVTTPTRFGSGVAINLAGTTLGVAKNLGVNLPTLIEGFAVYLTTLPASGWSLLKQWGDSGTTQVSLQVNSLGQFQFFQGSGTATPLGLPSAPVLTSATYVFLQVQISFSVSGGSIQCLLNSAALPIISANALNTAPSGNSWVNQVRFSATGAGVGVYFQDWYMLDMTGAAPFNTFLGNGRIFLSAPNADSATGGLNTWAFTTPQGSDFANFAQIPPNAADYNSSQTVGARASCRFPALPSTSRVFFFNTWESDELDAAGARTIAVITRNNAIDQQGPAISPVNGSYAYHNTISTIDPNTGQPWANGLVTNANAMEIGPVVVS